jgi:predicted GNAT family acetyltransferase
MTDQTYPVQHEKSQTRGRFFISTEKLLAEMTYSRSSAHLVIVDHTFVDPSQRGQGLGQILMIELIGWARATQTRIMPLCPFAKAQFDKHPEYGDVLAGNH